MPFRGEVPVGKANVAGRAHPTASWRTGAETPGLAVFLQPLPQAGVDIRLDIAVEHALHVAEDAAKRFGRLDVEANRGLVERSTAIAKAKAVGGFVIHLDDSPERWSLTWMVAPWMT